MAWTDYVNNVKQNLNITVDTRDSYITMILNGVVEELTTVQGLILSEEDPADVMLVVDYAAWRYRAREDQSGSSPEGAPQNLYWRIKNKFMRQGMAKNV